MLFAAYTNQILNVYLTWSDGRVSKPNYFERSTLKIQLPVHLDTLHYLIKKYERPIIDSRSSLYT